MLKAYHWPGNVRELENVLSRAVLKAAAGVSRGETVIVQLTHLGSDFTQESLPIDSKSPSTAETRLPKNISMKDATREYQRALIQKALTEHEGNWSAAARSLGMHRSNLHHLASRLGLK